MRYDYRVTADSYDFDETFDEIHPNLKSAREELRGLKADTEAGEFDNADGTSPEWYIERRFRPEWKRLS